MSEDTRPTHGTPPQDDPSDEQVLTWMSLAADDALDASTLRRLEEELAARPHLLEASSWIDRIDSIAHTRGQETALPPIDVAALRESVLDRVRAEAPSSAARPRAPWWNWRWAPAVALLALAGVFSWQQLQQEPANFGSAGPEAVEETSARADSPVAFEQATPPPPESATESPADPQPEFEPLPKLTSDVRAEKPAGDGSAREGIGERDADSSPDPGEQKEAVASRGAADADPPSPAREVRQQTRAVTPEGLAQNSDSFRARKLSPVSLDDESEEAVASPDLTDHAVDTVEGVVARQNSQAAAPAPAALSADTPSLTQLRLRLEEAETGAELDAQIHEILLRVPSPAPDKRELSYRNLAGRARSEFELEDGAASPLDSLVAVVRAREADLSDPDLLESLKIWLGRE